MLNKLEEVADRFREVEGLLSDPTVLNDQNRYRALTIEHSELIDVVKGYERCCRIREEIAGGQELLKDPDAEVREMANAEVSELETELTELEEQLKLMLLPKDPNDQRNVVLEVPPVPVVMKRLCLPVTFFACTADMPTAKVGRWSCSVRPNRKRVVTRK